MSLFFSIIKNLTDLIFPKVCLGCEERLIGDNDLFCLRCSSDLPFTSYEDQAHNPFEQHFTGRIPIEFGTSLFYFNKGEKIQRAIHDLKYGNNPHIGRIMGKMLAQSLLRHPVARTVEAVIPVPLHKSKERKRGYNQSNSIARGIAEEMKIPNLVNSLKRVRRTSTQTRKNRSQRLDNMYQAFQVSDPQVIRSKHILLVDDVLTSGATLESCGYAILGIADTRVSMATLAIGH